MRRQKEKTKAGCGVSGYILLAALFSFLGWAMETVFVKISSGIWTKRGFLSLPLCPIYGVCILAAHDLWQRIHARKPRGTKGEKALKTALCIAICLLLPSFMELAVGWVLDKKYHVKLWTYTSWRYNLGGYICLPVSLIWGGLLFVILRYFFPLLKSKIEEYPRSFKRVTAAFFTAVTLLDGVARFIQMTGAGLR